MKTPIALGLAASLFFAPGVYAAGENSPSTGNNQASITGTPDWSSESNYWRSNYSTRPYYSASRNYSVYEPAYRYGVEIYKRNPNRAYDTLSQSELDKGWTQARGNSTLSWQDAQQATRDAYDRMYSNRGNSTAAMGSATQNGSGGTTRAITSPGNLAPSSGTTGTATR